MSYKIIKNLLKNGFFSQSVLKISDKFYNNNCLVFYNKFTTKLRFKNVH
jgi:hypothetical protein